MEKYKTQFKLEVVNSFLAGEGGAKLLARRWSVPEEKIRTWVSRYRLLRRHGGELDAWYPTGLRVGEHDA